jgi:hypothetical protein
MKAKEYLKEIISQNFYQSDFYNLAHLIGIINLFEITGRLKKLASEYNLRFVAMNESSTLIGRFVVAIR